MKTKLNYSDVKNLAIFEPFVNRLAEISAKSTLKFIEQKESSNMIHDLRMGLAKDCKYLETLDRISEDERTEYKRDCLRDEMRLNNLAMTQIKKRMKREQDERELENLNFAFADLMGENEMLSNEIKCISDYLARIQPIISDTMTPNSFDLVNTARFAILYILQHSAHKYMLYEAIDVHSIAYIINGNDEHNNKVLDRLMDDIKDIIVAKKKLKTKEGYTLFTLKSFADYAVRRDINKKRAGIASKTNFLITGYDEYGNEQYAQADKLTTMGGITDIFRADEFKAFRDSLNLSESDNWLIRRLMEGCTESEIASRQGVSQQAIHKRIAKLRTRLAEYEIVQNMRRYHNNTK